MEKKSNIIITGASGVLGVALKGLLEDAGYSNVHAPTSIECNLIEKESCDQYFKNVKPEYVFHLAGRVYGLGGNEKFKASTIYENLLINTNVIHASYLGGVKKIVSMGTVAMYPDPAISIPAIENDLWKGYPHKSEESYAIAKLAMLSTLQAYNYSYGLEYSVALSTNLYGPSDRFNSDTGHVIPSLIMKFYNAMVENTPVEIWGTGIAERDFLYSSDAARGLLLIMDQVTGPANLVSGKVVKIKTVVEILSEISGVNNIYWDSGKPDGQLLRSYDSSKLKELGFVPEVDLFEGLQRTWDWYNQFSTLARK